MKLRLLLLWLVISANVVLAQSVESELKEVENKFYFRGNPINPWVIDAFQPWLSDGPIVMAVDLHNGNNSNRFFDTSKVKDTHLDYPAGGWLNYEYVGKTESGIHIVRTEVNGGGSGVFESILFFKFSIKKGFDYNGVPSDQLLMSLEKYYLGGDRTKTIITIAKNTVTLKTADNVQNPSYSTRTVSFDKVK